jgi:hypothetical protein
MSGSPTGAPGAWPEDPGAVLGWMRVHGERLQELVVQEARDAADAAPAGDAAVRAHLRFAAAAMEATAGDRLAEAVEGFSDELSIWFEEARDLFDEHLEIGAGAMALEAHLQFGALPGEDPSIDEGLRRRLRIEGWLRLFLVALERRLGPAEDGFAEAVLAWIGARRRELGRLIIWLDRRAKLAAAARIGRGTVDLAIQDEISQAAVVQAHVRQLVEAVSAVLTGDGGPAEDGAP